MGAAHVIASPPGPPPTPLGMLVARVGKQVDRAFDDALAQAGGTRPTWLIVLAVKTGAGHTQSAIAERIGISGPTLIHHLDRLEAAGLVSRARDATNRRIQNVALTASGERAFVRLREAAAAFDRRLHTGISDDELAHLRRLLTTISANVAPEVSQQDNANHGPKGRRQ
jgi:MarR family transcriptional regulator for hemolysin